MTKKSRIWLNLIPIALVTLTIAVSVQQRWQQSQATRPDYDDPTAIE